MQFDENLQRPSEIICKGDAAKAGADLGSKSTYAMPAVVRVIVQAELATTTSEAEGMSVAT